MYRVGFIRAPIAIVGAAGARRSVIPCLENLIVAVNPVSGILYNRGRVSHCFSWLPAPVILC